jgi:high-affinity K+ transport system ATPase subunit B
MTTSTVPFSLFERGIVKQAVVDSFVKLNPRQQMKNPVMFVVWIGSVLTTALFFRSADRFHPRSNAVAVVHRAVRQLCRSTGGRPQPRPG